MFVNHLNIDYMLIGFLFLPLVLSIFFIIDPSNLTNNILEFLKSLIKT